MIKKKEILILLLFIVAHIFILFNLRFTAWPEMFSYPYLRNNGFLIYKDMIHPYPPLLTVALSYVFKIFGYSLINLKIITYLMIFINDLLIFFISKKILKNKLHSFIPLIFYIFIQPFLDGNMLWFDFAITTPLLFSLLFLFKAIDKKNLKFNFILSGIFLSIATLIKQTSGIFFIASLIFFLFNKFKIKEVFLMFLGPLIMGLALLIRLIQEKAFLDFVNWTFIYPSKFFIKFPGYVRMDISRNDLLNIFLIFIPLMSFLFIYRKIVKQKKFILSVIFFICGLLAIYPRFSFFHFQIALAFLPVVLIFFLNEKEKKVFISIFLSLILSVYFISIPKIKTEWKKETRFLGFEEKMISKIIEENSDCKDKVYLFGSYSNLYIMANRIPPKRWFDNFGWYLEIDGVQEEILLRWREDLPQIILWQTPLVGQWFDLGVYQPKQISEFILKNYNRINEPYPGITLWKLK